MLLVKTKLGPSNIEGIGLFADQFIPKGTKIWKWAPGFDIRMRAEDLECLSTSAKETFLRYSYLSLRTGLYVLCFDNGRFINHSDTPNILDVSTAEHEEGLDIAYCDIEPSTELTCNYRDFDQEIFLKISGLKLS